MSASHRRQWWGRRNRLNWNKHSEQRSELSGKMGAAPDPGRTAWKNDLFLELVLMLGVGETEPFLLPLLMLSEEALFASFAVDAPLTAGLK